MTSQDLQSKDSKETSQQREHRKKSLEYSISGKASFPKCHQYTEIKTPVRIYDSNANHIKLTPAKLTSQASFLAFDTPNKDSLLKNEFQELDLSYLMTKNKSDLLFQNFEGNKTSNKYINVAALINSRDLKVKQKTTSEIISEERTTQKKLIRRELDSVTLIGAYEQSSEKLIEPKDHHFKEFKRRRPDADAISGLPSKCNCKLTECLKGYCSCFANGKVCNEECECLKCENFEGSAKREAKIKKQKKLKSYRKKDGESLGLGYSKTGHRKMGCKCSSSGCFKKYCECFRLGMYCSKSCKCKNCRNQECPSPEL